MKYAQQIDLRVSETKTAKPLTLLLICVDIEAMYCTITNHLKHQVLLKIRKINQKGSIFAIGYGYQNNE